MTAPTLDASARIGTVELRAADLPRLVDFYVRILGSRVLGEDADGVRLGSGPRERPLLSLTPAAVPRRPARTTGLYHVAILLPSRADLGRLVKHLVDKRARVEGAADHLVSEAVYLTDPEGNGLEFYADRPREAWPRDPAGALRMGTEALDAASLLEEAGDAPWTGLPPGTRVGHVHLKVADVDEAVRFYRDALGLDLVARLGEDAAFLAAGGYHHHVGINSWASRGAPSPPPDAPGLAWYEILVPDVRDMATRLVKADVPFTNEGGAALRLQDPSGNGVRVASAP